MTDSYWPGQSVVLVANCYDDSEPPVLTDPTTLVFTIYPPTGDPEVFEKGVDPEITRESQGIYTVPYVLALSGTYRVKELGTGAVTAVDWFEINVRKAPI